MSIQIEKGSLYLVTGGSGFLGKALIKKITSLGARVRCLSRNEGNMIKVSQDTPIEIYPGDVCDPVDVAQACKGVKGVFHLAAFKFVGLAEKFSRECIRSNILGSLNILEASLTNNFDFIIGISTDKAAQMNGVYGASKFLMEKLFEQFESINSKVKYRIVRYGNVMYSTGSVMCKWKELMLKNEPCVITDPNATRFYWTVDDAISLIFECLENSKNSSPYCPKMKSIRIGDLFKAMSELYYSSPVEPITIGLQQGENMHEVISKGIPDSSESDKYTVEEIKKML
jgi:UDP-N-acetylglucosamine 4,6-dehydratase